jgi:hypothetical protein
VVELPLAEISVKTKNVRPKSATLIQVDLLSIKDNIFQSKGSAIHTYQHVPDTMEGILSFIIIGT